MPTYTIPTAFNALDSGLYTDSSFRHQLTFREINKNNRYLANYKGKVIATKNYITNVGANTSETATIQEYKTIRNQGITWTLVDYFYAPISPFITSVKAQVYGRYSNSAVAVTGDRNICVVSISDTKEANKQSNEAQPFLLANNSALTNLTTFDWTVLSDIPVRAPEDVLLFYAKSIRGKTAFTGTFTSIQFSVERHFTGTQLTHTGRNVLSFKAWFNNATTLGDFNALGDGLGSLTNGAVHISLDLTSLATGEQQFLFTGNFTTDAWGSIHHYENLLHIDGVTSRGYVKGTLLGDINEMDLTAYPTDNVHIKGTNITFEVFETAFTDIKAISIYENDPR